MSEWTEEMVEFRLREAADVQRCLARPPGRGNDEYIAAPDAIGRMQQVMPWLTWLTAEDADIVWVRAEGARWKLICWRFAISRATADRRWRRGLSLIAGRLNARPVPSQRSPRDSMEQVRSTGEQ